MSTDTMKPAGGFYKLNVDAIRPLLLMVFAIGLANSIPLIAAKYLGLGRPWVNLDYALLAVLVVSRVRWLALLLLPFVFLIDVLTLVSQLFPVSRLVDVAYLLKFAALASIQYQFLLLIVVVITLLVSFCFWIIRPSKQAVKLLLICFNIGLLFYLVDVYAPKPAKEADRLWLRVHDPLVSSQLVHYYHHTTTGFFQSLDLKGPMFEDRPSPGMTEQWLDTIVDLDNRLLLIVSESWGLPVDPSLHTAIVQPLIDLGDQLEWLELGGDNFFGATIAAEVRELCELNPRFYNLVSAADELVDCLPTLLKARDYKTYAMHGAAGVMYDRVRWYPLVGFDEMIFFESRNWPTRCYSFPGACDIDMLVELEKAFSQPGKTFFYWLTLNSHSFYDKRDIRLDVFDCAEHGVSESSQACRNLKLHAQFFTMLAKTLATPAMSDVEVLIVGDHPPPIFNVSGEDEYFVENMVGWLHLKTR